MAALVGAQHTFSQIQGILESVATPHMKQRCSRFIRDITRAKWAGTATEG